VKEEDEEACFMNIENRNRLKFVWESRDFNVKPGPILQYIENIVLRSGSDENTTSCEAMKARLDKDFVFYNVWCRGDDYFDVSNPQQLLPSAKHFYEKGSNVRERMRRRRRRRKNNENREDK